MAGQPKWLLCLLPAFIGLAVAFPTYNDEDPSDEFLRAMEQAKVCILLAIYLCLCRIRIAVSNLVVKVIVSVIIIWPWARQHPVISYSV